MSALYIKLDVAIRLVQIPKATNRKRFFNSLTFCIVGKYLVNYFVNITTDIFHCCSYLILFVIVQYWSWWFRFSIIFIMSHWSFDSLYNNVSFDSIFNVVDIVQKKYSPWHTCMYSTTKRSILKWNKIKNPRLLFESFFFDNSPVYERIFLKRHFSWQIIILLQFSQ